LFGHETVEMDRDNPSSGGDRVLTDQIRATRFLRVGDPTAVLEAADRLRSGEAVVFPTDTVYGVGVDAFNPAAIEMLYTIKGRSFEKGIPILLADRKHMINIARSLPARAVDLMKHFWPGPLTVIVPRHPYLPAGISPNDTIAVRIPDHPIARALIRAAGGAVATTSANLSGQPPATTGQLALAALNGVVAVVLDDGPTRGNIASTIVDCTTNKPVILREGPLTAADLGLELATR